MLERGNVPQQKVIHNYMQKHTITITTVVNGKTKNFLIKNINELQLKKIKTIIGESKNSLI